MNGRDFLPVARMLAAGSGEAELRSAVSRAYYAAFHAARDLLDSLRFAVPRADRAHEYLYRRLNNCGLGLIVTAGRTLHSLRTRRNHADYEVGQPFPTHLAAGAVADATDILQAFDALTPAERTQVTDAMKLYEQQVGDVTWRP
jgi:uncharacterized protein (UPF0332 family)